MTIEQDDEKAAEEWRKNYRPHLRKSELAGEWNSSSTLEHKESFLAGIAHERKKHEWISVRIRQPEKPGNYLVYRIPRQYTEGVMAGRWAYSYAPITTRSWNGERWQSDQEVTHWQPLSNAPRELEEK